MLIFLLDQYLKKDNLQAHKYIFEIRESRESKMKSKESRDHSCSLLF